MVVASRYMTGGRQIGGPWLKGRLSRWGGVTLHHLAGFPVHDATNSFRLYDGAWLQTVRFESTGGFEIGFEVTLKAWMADERMRSYEMTEIVARGLFKRGVAPHLP